MTKVFLSYGRENTEQATGLAADLADLGYEVWFDSELTGGQSWWEQILRRIRECDAFVLALSQDSLESPACKREWTYAFDLRRNFLPVLVADGVDVDLLPTQLAGVQFTDYRLQDKAAVKRLMKALGALPAAPPLPDPLPTAPQAPISYLGGLREQIGAPGALSFQDQSALVMRIRQGLRNAKEREGVAALLREFRTREDLLARVADEIDELLESLPAPSVDAPAATPDRATTVPAAAAGAPRTAADRVRAAPASNGGEDPMLRGMRELTDRVRACFGPGRRTVLVPRAAGQPTITNRPIVVLREFVPAESAHAVGAQWIKSIALTSHEHNGAGGATTAMLAESIYRAGVEALRADANPTRLMKAIEATVAACVEELKKLSRPCRERDLLRSVANAAAGGSPLGEIVVEALDKVGLEGPIVVVEGLGRSDEVEIVEGMSFDRGFVSPHFVTDAAKQAAHLDNPYVLLFDQKISSIRPLMPVLEQVARAGRSLLVVAEDVDGEALSSLVAHNERSAPKVCAVKAPGFGDRRRAILEDLAIVTGGALVSGDDGRSLERVTLADLGQTLRVEVAQESTIVIGAAGDTSSIGRRTESIRDAIEAATSDYDREKLEQRLAALGGGVAIIRVGGPSVDVRRDSIERIETALRAVRAAIDEGIVPGAGHALLRAAVPLRTAGTPLESGAVVILDACQEPLRQLARNAGEDPDGVIARILADDAVERGFNPTTGEYGDLVEAGVVDSTKSARNALQNAAAVGVQLLWSSLTP